MVGHKAQFDDAGTNGWGCSSRSPKVNRKSDFAELDEYLTRLKVKLTGDSLVSLPFQLRTFLRFYKIFLF